jgi:hypothetical protein
MSTGAASRFVTKGGSRRCSTMEIAFVVVYNHAVDN